MLMDWKGMLSVVKRMALKTLVEGLDTYIEFRELVASLFAYSSFNAPGSLFRYRECGSDHSFDDVEKGRITLSRADIFPDKDDSAIHDAGAIDRTMRDFVSGTFAIDRVMRSAQGWKDEWSANEIFDVMKSNHRRFLEHGPEERERMWRDAIVQIKESVDLEAFSERHRGSHYVVCLCENGDSPYMWEKYGGHGTGYLIEYDVSDLRAIGAEDRLSPLILPVMYLDQLPDTFAYPFLLALREEFIEVFGEEVWKGCCTRELIKSLFCKKASYAPEEEWRLMLPSFESESGFERVFRKITPRCLVPGRRMEEPDKERLHKCAEENGIPFCDCWSRDDQLKP